MGKGRKARGARQGWVQADIDPGDEGRDRLRADLRAKLLNGHSGDTDGCAGPGLGICGLERGLHRHGTGHLGDDDGSQELHGDLQRSAIGHSHDNQVRHGQRHGDKQPGRDRLRGNLRGRLPKGYCGHTDGCA